MSEEQMKAWIKDASYKTLFTLWKLEPIGSPWFEPEIGPFFLEQMRQKGFNVPSDIKIGISKKITRGEV